MNRQDDNGMTTLTTGRSGQRFYRLLVVLVAVSVVAWGIGYRASLYSSRSLVRHSVPPARLLAHRACMERAAAQRVLQPAQHLFTRVAIPAGRQLAQADPLLRQLADDLLPATVRVALHRLRSPRPPPLGHA